MRLRTCSGCGYLHRVDKPCAACGERAPAVTMPSTKVWVPLVAALLLLMGGGAWWLWGPRNTATVTPPDVAEETRVTAPAIADARDATPNIDPSVAMVDSAPAPAVSVAAVRWQRARATTWVNVRNGATRDAEIVGRVRPDLTVELGEARGGWRAVRAGSVTGWVDPTLFVSDSATRTP